MIGEVKFYLQDENYGFIRTDNGDIFFHRSAVVGDIKLREYDRVEFDVSERRKKPCAKNVQLIPSEVGEQ
jgi:cold shock CspA family protein